MNAINQALHFQPGPAADARAVVSSSLTGADLTSKSFRAKSFRAGDIGDAMDPLVMVDHYVMTEPTFGEHPHAGMSAVSLLFEDSEGLFRNRDSLGNDFDLQRGDLYWLCAGSGAIHDESPRVNARIHGLQVFVNVPQTQRFESPRSLLVRSKDMPVIRNADACVKVALGVSNGVHGTASPSIPMTVLDGTLKPGSRFTHRSAANRGIWVQSIEGRLDVAVGEMTRHLAPGRAIAISTDSSAMINIRNPSSESAHFVLFDGARVREPYVHEGPFVMGSPEQIVDIKAAFKAGEFGDIAGNR